MHLLLLVVECCCWQRLIMPADWKNGATDTIVLLWQ